MKRPLLLKFMFFYAMIAACIFIIINTLVRTGLYNHLMEEKKSSLYEEALLIQENYISIFYSSLSLNNSVDQLKIIDNFLDTRIWIVNKDGLLVTDTRNPFNSSTIININNLQPDFLEGPTFSKGVTFPGVLEDKVLSVVIKITGGYEVKGYIVMHTMLDSLKATCAHYIKIINTCSFIFLFLMFLVFTYIYFLTVKPIKIIVTATKEYTGGHFDYPLEIRTQDELHELADAITYMAGELNSLDDYQKKFIANVSHDFRSPLTSIKGYVEAILDGTIPVENQAKYLDIILFESERLTKLTANLLSLNSFENRGNFLEISTFDINYIIKKTVASFERICTQKKIKIKLIFSDKETQVNADTGKIQQVLYNLLDNAIKFSHQNSEIKISTEIKNDKVFIAVKDYGIGIPKESLKKVWERFYKTDASRGKDKKGTGLGLSITKEIINAHGENINLISTEGVGTEFIFTLPFKKKED